MTINNFDMYSSGVVLFCQVKFAVYVNQQIVQNSCFDVVL